MPVLPIVRDPPGPADAAVRQNMQHIYFFIFSIYFSYYETDNYIYNYIA